MFKLCKCRETKLSYWQITALTLATSVVAGGIIAADAVAEGKASGEIAEAVLEFIALAAGPIWVSLALPGRTGGCRSSL